MMMKIKGLKLHEGQKRIVKEILNSDAKYHCINTSRQFGKTVLLSQLLLYYSINNKKKVIWYTAPTHAVAKRMYKFIYKAIKNTNVLTYHNKTDMELELYNNSIIKFTGVDKYDNLRGGSVDYFFCDEFAFYRDEAWNEVLKQMIATKNKGKAFFVSTPNGKLNNFYRFSKLAQSDENKRYQYHYAKYSENPYYDQYEVIDAKKTLPEFIFRQEYEAEFIDLSSELFQNLDDVVYSKPIKGEGPFYAGLDLGRQDDYTVLTIIDKNNKVIEWYRDNGKSWELMVNNVINILKKYNAPVLVEVNSIGDVIFEMIKKKWNKTYPFQTTGESKNPLIENMLIHFQNKDLLIPDKNNYKTLHDEISTYIVEYTASKRNFRYTHSVGFHDDTIDSLALSLYCKKNKQNIGVHFI